MTDPEGQDRVAGFDSGSDALGSAGGAEPPGTPIHHDWIVLSVTHLDDRQASALYRAKTVDPTEMTHELVGLPYCMNCGQRYVHGIEACTGKYPPPDVGE